MTNHKIVGLLCWAALLLSGCHPDFAKIQRESTIVGRLPVIKPDYAGITVPSNIAPMNFSLKDSSTACVAEISSANGSAVVAWGKKNSISINAASWTRLLAKNRGKPLRITIYAQTEAKTWHRYITIEDTIAVEPIDHYCTYRLLNFQYNYSSEHSECQRDLTSFSETVLVNTQRYAWGCVNCHMPMHNDPHRFVLQSRSKAYGSETLIANGDSLATIKSRLGYTAWHPGGKYIAFAVYKVEQFFHAVGKQCIDVCDNNSFIVLYDVAAQKIVPVPLLNKQGTLETWPVWSPDGGYLYFCSAEVSPEYFTTEPPKDFEKVKYSLLRISFDADKNSWGEIDTVLATQETGLSIAQPKISPDGRFCLFCMQNYGAYPHTQVSSDLYLMDIATRQYNKLPINSEYNESWHSWSKNGRWILFSSKREGGIFTRIYFSYIDSAGNAHKPFLLPQRDPAFYDSFIKCYNVPEFAVAPVRFSERQLLNAIKTRKTISVPVPQNANATSNNSAPAAWTPGPSTHQ